LSFICSLSFLLLHQKQWHLSHRDKLKLIFLGWSIITGSFDNVSNSMLHATHPYNLVKQLIQYYDLVKRFHTHFSLLTNGQFTRRDN
jgi:hypothetical protein